MCKRSLFLSILFFSLASAAWADSTIYAITVNTSSISGTSGSLDFQFNPGAVSQLASAEIVGFTSDGTLGGSAASGDASGMLPANIVFDNLTAFNDYFTAFTYGTTLAFDVSLFGPALSSPDGTSTSGSAFAFSMFSDAAGTTPALTTDMTNGFAVTVDVNLDGTTTLNNFSTQTTTGTVMATTPEPPSLSLLCMGLAGFALFCPIGMQTRKTRLFPEYKRQ